MTSLFCFGLGYSAEALARRVRPLNRRVAGTARTKEGLARLASLGYDAFLFDGTAPGVEIADALADTTHVLVSAGPDQEGDPTLRFHESDLARAPNLRWIGYLSTIGVYGNTDGAWIDETAAPNPGHERAKRRVAAEDAWLAFGDAHGKRVQIFRLGGIYGPGRSAFDDLRDGTARRIVKPGQVFNRIHVDDIASVLLAAANGAGQHTIYNVTDGTPSPSQEMIAHAADMLGIRPPPEISVEDANLSPMGKSFYAENRRVANDRLQSDLGVTLAYPSYREGLAAILANSRS
ncbi:SDR family oxidoreductase [Hyphomicrobium sp.]|uniref:SDR family oxidoreductase n=1 Tax=Hyphomicrobium sp. TaxID=82 RepID=UPI002C8470B9|nr:SDR family oxidoreductase [Hyphomicrobium sp.]HRN88845.1 SDR family oxidoreductase [Hyphomicrobium sp.]HRQ27644.1 SDR family oxidoreductase [Hyphomicrobium sp.]